MASNLATLTIHGYRRFVSPYKGFRCAYHALYDRGSCSDIALKIAARHGALTLVRLLPLQAARCRAASLQVGRPDPERDLANEEGPNTDKLKRGLADGVLAACACWP